MVSDIHKKWFSPGDIYKKNIQMIQDSLNLKVDLPEDRPQCATPRFRLNDIVGPDLYSNSIMESVKDAEHNRLAKQFRIGPNMDLLIKARLMVVHYHNLVEPESASLERVRCFRFNYVGTSWSATLVIEGIDTLSYVVGYDLKEKKTYITQHKDTGHWEIDDDQFFHIYGARD